MVLVQEHSMVLVLVPVAQHGSGVSGQHFGAGAARSMLPVLGHNLAAR